VQVGGEYNLFHNNLEFFVFCRTCGGKDKVLAVLFYLLYHIIS